MSNFIYKTEENRKRLFQFKESITFHNKFNDTTSNYVTPRETGKQTIDTPLGFKVSVNGNIGFLISNYKGFLYIVNNVLVSLRSGCSIELLTELTRTNCDALDWDTKHQVIKDLALRQNFPL